MKSLYLGGAHGLQIRSGYGKMTDPSNCMLYADRAIYSPDEVLVLEISSSSFCMGIEANLRREMGTLGGGCFSFLGELVY
jgi:hypothetical protein